MVDPVRSQRSKRSIGAGGSFQDSITKTLHATTQTHGGWAMRQNDRITWGGFKHTTPYDHVYVGNEVSLLIECKAVYDQDVFIFNRVTKEQVRALLEFTLSGPQHLGIVFFAFYQFRKRPKIFYAIPITALLERPRSYRIDTDDPRVIKLYHLGSSSISLYHLNEFKRLREEVDERHALSKLRELTDNSESVSLWSDKRKTRRFRRISTRHSRST
jgi:Holliday junction resolvase